MEITQVNTLLLNAYFLYPCCLYSYGMDEWLHFIENIGRDNVSMTKFHFIYFIKGPLLLQHLLLHLTEMYYQSFILSVTIMILTFEICIKTYHILFVFPYDNNIRIWIIMILFVQK